MKYEIKRATGVETFTPFSVTITLETREEWKHFHDKVMGVLTQTEVHDFHGHIYCAGARGEVDGVSGRI